MNLIVQKVLIINIQILFICYLSKFEVGSSKAKKQQLLPKHSAKAILKTMDANIF